MSNNIRLTDLSPRMLHPSEPFAASTWHEIAFLCPKCRGHEICVAFWELPASDRVQVDNDRVLRLWQRSGVPDFNTLTLSPSINRESCGDKCGGWHGFITEGRIA